MPVTLKIIERIDGDPERAGEYVVDYDPVPRLDASGEFIHLITSPYIAKARQFEDAAEALEYWRQSAGLRADGKPNRPLTAYTVEIEKVEAK